MSDADANTDYVVVNGNAIGMKAWVDACRETNGSLTSSTRISDIVTFETPEGKRPLRFANLRLSTGQKEPFFDLEKYTERTAKKRERKRKRASVA